MLLSLCSAAFAQISTKHRGYDIPAKKNGRKAGVLTGEEAEKSDPGALTKRNLYLIFSPGVTWGSDIKFDGVNFGSSTLGHADLSLHYFPYRYLGLGISVSYMGDRTDGKQDVFAPGDTAAVRYNSWGLGFMMLGRYPLRHAEPYASAGITYNINYIARDYTGNTEAENGESIGCLFEAGLRWFVSEPAFVGVSARYTYNSQEADNGSNVDLGGTTLFLNIGYSF